MLPAVVVDRELGRRLAVHEATIHARSGRELRDLGDGLLLHDPADPEPFWNRLVAPAWPAATPAFERRLDEVITLFAALGRLPHVRTLPLGSEPPDAVERLLDAGFLPVGRDRAMVLTDTGPAIALARTLAARRDLRLDRVNSGPASRAMDVARILVDAFEVESDRIPALAAEALAAARRPGGATLLLLADERPVAAVRSVTLGGATYLSSIGTVPAMRRRGYASLLTAIAIVEALAVGTTLVHLLADAGSDDALRLYERLGFIRVGEPIADLLLRAG